MDQSSTEPLPHLAAGGSLSATAPAGAGRARRIVELVLLYIALPLVITYLVRVRHFSILLLLQPVMVAIIVFLLLDRTFSVKRELGRLPPLRLLVWILVLFAIVTTGLSEFVAWFLPAEFLALPRHVPMFWAIIMVFYPLLSALPQEMIYRTLFFHRFGALFGNSRALAAAVNGALFGFAHIMFGSLVSVALSAALGFVIAWRYAKQRSFWAAFLEHALYGDLIFTIGLGHYFFTGSGFSHH